MTGAWRDFILMLTGLGILALGYYWGHHNGVQQMREYLDEYARLTIERVESLEP